MFSYGTRNGRPRLPSRPLARTVRGQVGQASDRYGVAGSKERDARYRVVMQDPGLARHEWETEWQALEPLLEDSPYEALPELADLVERMMIELAIPINDEVADGGIEPEITREYREARGVADLLERGEDVAPGDVGSAIRSLRLLYDNLINELST